MSHPDLQTHFATEAMRALVAANHNSSDPYHQPYTEEQIGAKAWEIAEAMIKAAPEKATTAATKSELSRTKSELRSEKIQHTKTMQTLHGLQRQLEARKQHCLEAHQCCYEPAWESLVGEGT
jgi:hypothetical protein